MQGNVTLTKALNITYPCTIDLNGYTIENKTAGSYSGLDDAGDECIVFFVSGNDAHLTLNATNGGDVKATGDGVKSNYNVAVWVANGAKATINGGNFSNSADTEGDGCDLIYGRDGVEIFINGGKFTPAVRRSTLGKNQENNNNEGVYACLNCKDNTDVIYVSGGDFYQFGAVEAGLVGKDEVKTVEGYSWSTTPDANGYYSVNRD